MKKETYDCLGVSLSVDVAESLEEAVELAGSEQVVLDQWNASVAYRGGVLGAGRKILCDYCESKPNFERKKTEDGTKTEKDEEGNEVTVTNYKYEAEGTCVKRALAEGVVTKEELQKVLDQAIANGKIEFDPKPRPKAAPKSKKPRKKFLETAQRFFDNGKVDAAVARIGSDLNQEIDSTDMSVETLALLLQTWEDYLNSPERIVATITG